MQAHALTTRYALLLKARRLQLDVGGFFLAVLEDFMPKCLDCDAEIILKPDVEAGEIVDCPDCGIEFEVRSLAPVNLEHAPQEEEDWGE